MIRLFSRSSSTRCVSDEASALYALFGKFYIGLRLPVSQMERFLDGMAPEYEAPAETAHPGARPPA